MDNLSITDKIFFEQNDLNKTNTIQLVNDGLVGFDDGELFLEYCQSENITFDDGHIRGSSFDNSKGFGFRAICGEIIGYSHSSDLDKGSIINSIKQTSSVKKGYKGKIGDRIIKTNQFLYANKNELPLIPYETKVKTLEEIDRYARNLNSAVKQVSASLNAEWQAIQIIKNDGYVTSDIRPLIRLNVSIVVEKNGRMEVGSYGTGGRGSYSHFLKKNIWKNSVDEALRQALVNLESIETPGGEMPVVLGPGWPGILLHEAIGHGLEGDFNRKKTSAFSELMGKKVASEGVTVVDDGTIPDRRGSLTIDDEGTPSSSTTLIEDGILVGLIQDRQNSRLMGKHSTGNGRRESYAHTPMPRMTNTYMAGGNYDPMEIINSVQKGLYAVNFGGGQVDITSGKFVFSATEAYLIENGKVTSPVKGATLIGNGPDCLTKVSMIGNDMSLDPGIGTCGKEGQGVPVGVGQPTLKIDSLTVGGTAV